MEHGGRLGEAEAQYREALRIQSDSAMAHFNLGTLLDRTGKVEEAIFHYREALRLNPGHREAYTNLMVLLGDQGLPAGSR